ncbi:NUDIX hydrolase [Amycolatopsis sp. K13G38]|uniref:NUDIX hydrolase n=1 Tax=Amycolatopsis acididurans TaxID=2724524 RepID=A0ABX1IZR4_9PSEU|nr:NUDIX hydrolase [Amycolatopsis acididurans]NKQ52924.1 NUDIX hydrolase [Amycolatopsis acididurans]
MDLLPFDEYVRSLDRKRMSAGVLFRDSDDRVLLVEPSYKSHWEIPGGAVDAGEAPWAAARREVREELGFDRAVGRPLVIDHVPDDGHMPEGLAFIFDGGFITAAEVAALDLTDPEIISAGLFHLETTAAKLKTTLALRLAAAVEASRTGGLLLCDNGNPSIRG